MYVLINAQQMQRQHPETFQALSISDLKSLSVGSFVKVCAETIDNENPIGERFWVSITEIQGDHLSGKVQNSLVCSAELGIDLGDEIDFRREHIFDTLYR